MFVRERTQDKGSASESGNLGKGRSKSRGSNKNKTCDYWKLKGHIKKDFWKLKKKNDEEARDGTSNADASYVNDTDGGGVLVATHGYKDSDEWILDLGCTFHMTPNKTFFQTFESVDGGNVTMGNNTTYKVVGVGSVKMKMFDGMVRTLTDVRYVPGLKKNLISLGILDKIGCKITCEGGVIKVARGSLVVMKGKLNRSLYAFKGSTILGSANISTSTMSDHDTKLWHLRLGHMGELKRYV